MTDTDDSKNM